MCMLAFPVINTECSSWTWGGRLQFCCDRPLSVANRDAALDADCAIMGEVGESQSREQDGGLFK